MANLSSYFGMYWFICCMQIGSVLTSNASVEKDVDNWIKAAHVDWRKLAILKGILQFWANTNQQAYGLPSCYNLDCPCTPVRLEYSTEGKRHQQILIKLNFFKSCGTGGKIGLQQSSRPRKDW